MRYLTPFITLLLLCIFSLESYGQVASAGIKILGKKDTGITNPFELRDPFKRNLPKRSRLKRSGGTKYFDGEMFTNIDTIDGVPIEQIRVVGVLLGPNRRAIVKIVKEESTQSTESSAVVDAASASQGSQTSKESSKTFVLKEGMKLGLDGAVVKAILPGGIVLVEKIRNVYDQDEYLETIIPVSE